MLITNTMEPFPHSQIMPKTSSTDAAIQAALQLTHALHHPAPAAPFANLGQPQITALQELASIFTSSATSNNMTNNAPQQAVPTSPRVEEAPEAKIVAVPRAVESQATVTPQSAQTYIPDKPDAPLPNLVAPTTINRPKRHRPKTANQYTSNPSKHKHGQQF